MRPAGLYAAMDLPEATRLHRRVFKKHFHDHADLRPAEKRALADAVGTITWAYTLKPATVPIPVYRQEGLEYVELTVLELELTTRAAAARVCELVHRAIPYPLLLVLGDDEGLCLTAAFKRPQQGGAARTVIEAIETTPWLNGELRTGPETEFLGSMALSRLPQTHIFALYEGYVQRILALACATHTDRFDVEPQTPYAARRAALDAYLAEARSIQALRGELRAASSFARQVELNTQIKALEARLQRITPTL